jgi:hypothetical protein
MTTLFIGETVDDAADAAGHEPGSSAGLAAAIASFGIDFEAERPGTVVLTDASDRAIAALLVATKLLIPVEAVVDARDAATPNGRVIGQLTATYTPAA